MSPFSVNTHRILAKAGWTEDYRCPMTEAYVEALLDAGCPVHAAARGFIERFGGLRFSMPHARVPDREDNFHTVVDGAIDDTDEDSVHHWSQRIGSQLCIIGEAYRDHMTLVIDEAGRLYAGDGVLLVRIGDSPEDAIEKLCTGQPSVRVD